MSQKIFQFFYRGIVVTAGILLVLIATNTVDRVEVIRSLAFSIGCDPVGDLMNNPSTPGSAIHYSLTEKPRASYGRRSGKPNEHLFGRIAAESGYAYQASLGQAAREVAHFYREHRRLAPTTTLNFILDAAGATYWSVRQTVIVTTDSGRGPIRRLLDRQSKKIPENWHVGIGEYVVPGVVPVRILVALAAQETVSLARTRRTYQSGDVVQLAGKLSPEYRDITALAMSPGGVIKTLPIRRQRNGFRLSLKVKTGAWTVELIAVGPMGPVPLTQMTFYVDQTVPSTHHDRWAPDDTLLANGTTYLGNLINQERRRWGAQPLIRDQRLDRIALDHSVDMQESGYVGHVSPNTGSVGDRLEAASYKGLTYGENVALNATITDAHEGLIRSLGHRKNLLSNQFTHVGLGLIKGRNGWYVTQIFTRPHPDNTVSKASSRVPMVALLEGDKPLKDRSTQSKQ